MDGKSLDITRERLNKLKEILPDAFTEGKIDWEKLQASLGENIEFKNERYVLNWAGKSDAFRVLQSTTTATLVPCKEESVGFDDTENIFIEGENLEVLTVLQKSYFGKIKMIYIDPPYNTGNDKFIYPDKFSETRDEYLSRIGDKDETGYMTREGIFRKNSKDSGHYHSNWLSMMYPRLFLARNLLKEDGVIFVSIDDNEVHNLRLLMNEVFGEENYMQEVVWKRHAGGGNDSRYFAVDHEYILVYARSKESIDKLRIPLNEKEKAEYYGKDEYFETLGPFKEKSFLRMRPDDPRKGLQYTIEAPDGEKLFNEWKWEEPRFLDAYKKGKVILRKDRSGKWQVEYKIYLNFSDGGEEFEQSSRVPRSLLTEIERNSEGKKQLRQIMGKDNIFNNPKPIGLIEHLIAFGSDANDIILDFFAGSSTTAHAVLAQNAEDNEKRKFIQIQMPEPTHEDSDALKADYKTWKSAFLVTMFRMTRFSDAIDLFFITTKSDFQYMF
jgi:adenine-specific DNA-methyltransferase